MATRTRREHRHSPRPSTAPKTPVCPACGGLECLCRPRFFAGQLLTEVDLNRLDRYIRDKNRLHNRYLHGWGVVCGLEVSCDECADHVRVGAGYGLSPCGDDIIVCQDERVDVCKLLRRCREEERHCGPLHHRWEGCEGEEETWILAICYDEKPSREVPVLRKPPKCGCGCGGGCGCSGNGHGGSNGNGGCGCNGKKNGATGGHQSHSPATSASRAPALCEPSVICEGYCFQLMRLPEEEEEDIRRGGPLIDRFEACSKPYMDLAAAVGNGPDAGASRAQRYQFCCSVKRRLRKILIDQRIGECELLTELDHVVCPSPDADLTDAQFDAAMDAAGDLIMHIWFVGLLSCVCHALLPPCPAPAPHNCIPLATVRVRRADCHVLEVCNWTVHRKFATTFPALQYWLSMLPFGRLIREVLEEFCCNLSSLFQPKYPGGLGERFPPGSASGLDSTTGFATHHSTAGGASPFTAEPGPADVGAAGVFRPDPFLAMETRDFSTIALRAALGRLTPLTPAALFGRRRSGLGAEGGLQEIERENLPHYLLGSALAQPVIRSMLPEELSSGRVLSMLEFMTAGPADYRRGEADEERRADASEVERLREEVAELRRMVEDRPAAKRARKRRGNQ